MHAFTFPFHSIYSTEIEHPKKQYLVKRLRLTFSLSISMLLSKLESEQAGMLFLIDLKQCPLKHSILLEEYS